jgi:RNA polymerase sigma factor (sigma-70 family)
MTYSFMPSPSLDSVTLMRAAARGDQAAWICLYEMHEPWMRAYVRARIPTHLRARFDDRDMVQDAFLCLAKSPGVLAIDDGEGLRRFLRELLRNVLTDEVRHHQRQRRSTRRETRGEDHTLDALVSNDLPPCEQVERADMQDFVGEALQRLPVQDRDLLCDRFVDCLTWVEISRRIGVSEPTARRRGQDALERLLLRRD